MNLKIDALEKNRDIVIKRDGKCMFPHCQSNFCLTTIFIIPPKIAKTKFGWSDEKRFGISNMVTICKIHSNMFQKLDNTWTFHYEYFLKVIQHCN